MLHKIQTKNSSRQHYNLNVKPWLQKELIQEEEVLHQGREAVRSLLKRVLMIELNYKIQILLTQINKLKMIL